MLSSKRNVWIGGTVFVVLVIMLATWFLAVSPTLTTAAETRAEAEFAESTNAALEARIVQLAADFEKLPEYKAELDALRTQIPTTPALADFIRQLDGIAVAHSVTITGFTPAAAQEMAAAAPVAEAPATPEEGAEEVAAPATTTPVASPLAGLAAIPVTVTVLGSYENTLAFLDDLQTIGPRVLLVTGFTSTAQKESEAGGGRPATVVGDQELAITGLAYVLPDALLAAAPDESELPAAVPGKNPLIPVGGDQ